MTGARNKNTYTDRKARGVCTACGLRKPRQGVLTCRECAIKKSEDYYRRTERLNSDLRQLRMTMEGDNGKK